MDDLLWIKDSLRSRSRAERAQLCLTAQSLAAAYSKLRANAPRRADRNKTFLSPTRTGVPAIRSGSRRHEEHLAAALFQRGALFFSNGARLQLVDYQFPLKARRDDASVGKIDLLGVLDDGTLVIIELKTGENVEDRRIALLEGLIYAAIVEANLEPIAREIEKALGLHIARTRPQLFVLAPPEYWTAARTTPDAAQLSELIAELAATLPITVRQLELRDASLVGVGTEGMAPRLLGHAILMDRHENPPPAAAAGLQADYLQELRSRFWAYADGVDPPGNEAFDARYLDAEQSPVFRAELADRNILTPPQTSHETVARIVSAIATPDRHKWFASMASSQALAQSVFAGLRAFGRLDALSGLAAEDGAPAFFESLAGHDLDLEYAVESLNEPRPTSIDVLIRGSSTVAVEIKFTEKEFGRCSRPALSARDKNFARDHCDGTYSRQRDRVQRCSLSQSGIRYWEIAPRLFDWDADVDHRPCPLSPAYQLARNVMAACTFNGSLDTQNAHALVIYDGRNPAFLPGGDADRQWWTTLAALRHPRLLRRLSWQRLAQHLRQFDDLAWLCDGLRDKYGFA